MQRRRCWLSCTTSTCSADGHERRVQCPSGDVRWLLLKDDLVDQGVSVISGSRDAVREAVVRELLPAGSEDTSMSMIRSRNLTSHTYNPELANEIAVLIVQRYAPALLELQRLLLEWAQRR
jgi:hypothetical protein